MCGRSFVRSSSLISPSVRGRGILWLVSLFPLFSLPPPHLPPLIPSFPSLVIFALSASFSPILFHHSLASPSPSSLLPPFLFCLVHCLLHLPSSMPNPNAVSTPSKNQPPPTKKKERKVLTLLSPDEKLATQTCGNPFTSPPRVAGRSVRISCAKRAPNVATFPPTSSSIAHSSTVGEHTVTVHHTKPGAVKTVTEAPKESTTTVTLVPQAKTCECD